MKPQSTLLQNFSFNRIFTIILIAVMLLAAAPIRSASADSVGNYSPTKATSNGPGWTNPIYALASDNLYATARKNNRQLKLSSFYIPAIPGGAVINGIEVTVEGLTTGTQADVALSAGSSFTSSKPTTFTSTESTLTLGGPTDTWGKTWSATDFQNKFTVKLTTAATSGLMSIDHVQIKVYYTPPNTTLVLNPVFGDYGATTTMTARLTERDTQLPLAGKTVNFTLNGASAGSDVTDANGYATISNVSLAGIAAGDYPYGSGASFARDGFYEATSITADLRVYGLLTTLTVSSISGDYLGSTGPISATLKEQVSGLPISGKTISFTLNEISLGSAITNAAGVASISGITLTGYDAGTYAGALEAVFTGELNVEPATATGTLTVNALPVTIVGGLTPASRTYDGTTNATLTIGSPTLSGVVAPDVVNLETAGATAAFLDKNAGTAKTVQISGLSLSGAAAFNYTLTLPTRQADIAKAMLTVTADNKSITIGSPEPAFTFQYSGWMGSDTAADLNTAPTCTVSGPHAALGAYPIVCSGGADENYDFTYVNGTFLVGVTNVDVYIGGGLKASYTLGASESKRESYVATNSGPVQIVSSNNHSLMAAERVIYKVNGVATSFTEMMGLPGAQLDNTYWFPWYNNVDLDTQLRFGNVSASTATVHVYIGGVEMTGSPFALVPGESTRKSFVGVNNGPVKIVSDVNIVAAERLIYKVNGVNTSFSEMMGLPNSQLNNTYWLPWYNNTDLDTQLRFANVSGSPATVHVYIGGQEMQGSPFALEAGASTRKSFPGINNGPVKIQSDVNIVAAERVIYKVNGKNTSFTEMMALPTNQLSTTYWMPWYNNVDLDTQLRFGNVSNTTATVRVFIGGVEMQGSPFALVPGASTRLSFTGVNKGPVKIVSDVPIVAAERVIYKVSGVNTSFSEMMGLPNQLLNGTYWLPWYNNADLDTQLRFGVP
jgi:hypothetical protein